MPDRLTASVSELPGRVEYVVVEFQRGAHIEMLTHLDV